LAPLLISFPQPNGLGEFWGNPTTFTQKVSVLQEFDRLNHNKEQFCEIDADTKLL
jgi:hypothetical protein